MKLKSLQYKKNRRFRAYISDNMAGFTMMEAVVALALLSITMTAVFYALRSCSTAAHHSRMLTNSVFLAENLLVETLLDENTAYETREGQDGLYSWRLQIAPTPAENLGAIHVRVEWQEQNRDQQYDLFSLVQMKSFTE